MTNCPFCNWGETDNEINLARHFEKEHEYKSFLMLARILLKQKGLEQKIKARIKELEPMLDHDNWCGLTATRIDELRKLLS